MNKTRARILKIVLMVIGILAAGCLAWIAFSLIGRIKASSIIPDSAIIRVSVPHPVRFLDGVMTHGSLEEIPVLNTLKETSLLKNRLFRFAARRNLELALLPSPEGLGTGGSQLGDTGSLVAAWDMGLLAPLLRFLPAVSGFIKIPNLYYVLAGNNSRFELRMEGMTLFIGPYRNLLFITDNSAVYESRFTLSGSGEVFTAIKPSSYDAAIMFSHDFIGSAFAQQHAGIAAVLNNIEFDSKVEAGLSIYPKKLEFRITVPVSSRQPVLSRLLEQRSGVPGMAERIPAAAQYATILSAGTLEELYQAAHVFSPDLGDTLKTADTSSRAILGFTLNDLLFSWSGKEFAVFGMEGRPHPVYAVQIADERKRKQVFDKAFKSIALNEDVRLNLDGTRIPRIEVPEFLQKLLQKWDLFLPSPYYIVHKDFLFASESAEALLSALRAMQRNDVLPKTAVWRDIAGGKTTLGGSAAASAFSLYYSIDRSIPFFLRGNTSLSEFLSLYRQGLLRMSFNRGLIDISLSLVPGSGGGVTLVNGYPLDIGGRPSNRIYGTGGGDNSRIFFTSGGSSIALNVADNRTYELSGQGAHWVIPADGIDGINAWVVGDRGRVTLADANMEPAQGFPVLTGLRLSSPPTAYEGKLYLCDEEGKVHTVNENGEVGVWETSFAAALRTPPSFLTVSTKKSSTTYAAVYPKSFFGEIWLLDANGKAFPNWPAPLSAGEEDGYTADVGIGFGSPFLFTHNNRLLIAFVNQAGRLFIYDENAAPVPPFPLNLNGVFYIQPVFDGEFLWLASSDGAFFRVSLDGDVLYQHIADFSVKEEGHITIFDSDGNKVPEVYITGEGNALHAYTRNFRSLAGFPLPVWGKVLFIPAQGNRKAEILGMGMDRRLYRWQFR